MPQIVLNYSHHNWSMPGVERWSDSGWVEVAVVGLDCFVFD